MSSARADRNAEVQVALTQPGAGVGAGVALVAMSHDAPLLDALEAVVTSDHAIHIVASEDALAECIIAARCGVALIDAESAAESVDHLSARLRAQFPELVLIIAGRDTHQSALASLIATGVIYRFLHKPVSTQRVRQFVDAALRRHDEEHAGAAPGSANTPAATAPPRRRSPQNLPLLGAAVIMAVVVAIGVYFVSGPRRSPTNTAATPAALAAASAAARLNKLLGDAEQAIVQGREADATRLLDEAKGLQPDNVRVAFLTGQLGKARERAVLTKARNAAANGDFNQALAALDGANATAAGSSTLTETRRDLEKQQIDERVRTLLRQGNERLQAGKIGVPEGDNALFHLEAARALAPRDPGVVRLEQVINSRILSEARATATRGDATGTNNWLKLASERRLGAAEIDNVRVVLATAQGSTRTAELARQTTSINELIIRGRSDDSALEAARTALSTLRSFEGNGPVSRDAQGRLASALLTRGRALLDAGKLDEAQKALSDAQTLGAVAEVTAGLSVALAAQRERQRRDTDIVGANTLKRIRSPEPVYPPSAIANSQKGWVDVIFLVKTDGRVTDTKVVSAEPAGVFDRAATDCLARWRFEPVMRDGKAIEQRARLRVRFNID